MRPLCRLKACKIWNGNNHIILVYSCNTTICIPAERIYYCKQGCVGSSLLEDSLCFHLSPPVNSFPISPQARVSLLLLLFHLLSYDHPLFPCCGPTCHVKKPSLWGKTGSAGKNGLRTSSPAGPRHMLTHSLLLWWKHLVLNYITFICQTVLPKATCNGFQKHKGERARYHPSGSLSNKWLKACWVLQNTCLKIFFFYSCRHACKWAGILTHTCSKVECNLLMAMLLIASDVFCLLSAWALGSPTCSHKPYHS